MKKLTTYLEELTTPSNTLGIGNPTPPGEGIVGSEPLIPIKSSKKKKKKVAESLLDNEEKLMDLTDHEIRIIQWLSKHCNTNKKEEELFSVFSKYIKFNSDGSFDLPPSHIIGKTRYNFIIEDELPDYIVFNKIASSNVVFLITKTGNFKLTGFPKIIQTDNGLLGNVKITANKVDELTIPSGILNTVDVFEIEGEKLSDIWMDKYATILSLNINYNLTTAKKKKCRTQVHNIPFACSNILLIPSSIEFLLKDAGILSWSSNLYI